MTKAFGEYMRWKPKSEQFYSNHNSGIAAKTKLMILTRYEISIVRYLSNDCRQPPKFHYFCPNICLFPMQLLRVVKRNRKIVDNKTWFGNLDMNNVQHAQ